MGIIFAISLIISILVVLIINTQNISDKNKMEDLSSSRQKFVSYVQQLQQYLPYYDCSPCKRCKETKFFILDVSPNAKSLHIQCQYCEKKSYLKAIESEDVSGLVTWWNFASKQKKRLDDLALSCGEEGEHLIEFSIDSIPDDEDWNAHSSSTFSRTPTRTANFPDLESLTSGDSPYTAEQLIVSKAEQEWLLVGKPEWHSDIEKKWSRLCAQAKIEKSSGDICIENLTSSSSELHLLERMAYCASCVEEKLLENLWESKGVDYDENSEYLKAFDEIENRKNAFDEKIWDVSQDYEAKCSWWFDNDEEERQFLRREGKTWATFKGVIAHNHPRLNQSH